MWANDPFIDRIIQEKPAKLLPKEFKDYGELIRAAYGDLSEAERTRTWGEARQVRFPHPIPSPAFQIPPFPKNGATGSGPGATVNVGANVSMRLIVRM